jgi:hypothetical protein
VEIITGSNEAAHAALTILFHLSLIFAGHVAGDVLLQMNRLSKLKRKHLWALGLHVFLWTAMICFVLLYLKIFAFWKMLFLYITHFIIDWLKSFFKPTPGSLGGLTKVDVVDQLLHLATLGLVYFF